MKKLNTLMWVILFSFILLSANVTFAGPVIYDNGPPNGSDGPYIDNLGGTRFEAADDFFLEQGDIIADVHFWTMEADNWAGVIEWTIYYDDENGFFHPDGVLASGYGEDIVKTLSAGLADYEYSFDLDVNVVLPSSDWYWLGLHLPGSQGDINWAQSAWNTDASSVRQVDLEGWTENGYDLAFSLTTVTTVPEPATILLLGTGLIGLGYFGRKKKKMMRG